MEILVTGVSGRVGSNLARALLERGNVVRGLVMPGDPKLPMVRELGITIVESDLTDANAVHRAVEGVDAVVHLAALMVQGNMPSDTMFNVNVLGTLNLLEGVRRTSPSLGRFVYASTGQAYPPFELNASALYEDRRQLPRDLYSHTKFLSERICEEYMREYGIPVTVVRYASVLAAGEPLKILAPPMLSSMIDQWTAPGRVPWFGHQHVEAARRAAQTASQVPDAACAVVGPGGTPWSLTFTDVRDAVAGTLRALESPHAVGDTFNISGPAATSWVEAARLISMATDRVYQEVLMPFVWTVRIPIDRARTAIGYEPKYGFREMLESALSCERGEDIGVIAP